MPLHVVVAAHYNQNEDDSDDYDDEEDTHPVADHCPGCLVVGWLSTPLPRIRLVNSAADALDATAMIPCIRDQKRKVITLL